MAVGHFVQNDAPQLTCSVTGEYRGQTVLLSGLVNSTADAQGRYMLKVVKAGPSGSSTLNQGGAFSAHAGTATRVGSVSIGVEPGASFDVVLTLEVGGDSYTCEKHGTRS